MARELADAGPGQGTEPVELVVLDGVTELSWRFLDNNLDWQTVWPRPT